MVFGKRICGGKLTYPLFVCANFYISGAVCVVIVVFAVIVVIVVIVIIVVIVVIVVIIVNYLMLLSL